MDVRIGVTHSPKELHIELGDDADHDQVIAQIDAAVKRATDDGPDMLWLTDRKGRRVGVPAAKIAWVEVGSPDEARVGFGARR